MNLGKRLIANALQDAPVTPVPVAAPTPAPSPVAVSGLGVEADAWVHAHRSAAPPSKTPDGTALIFVDPEVQDWMGETLVGLGWIVTEPVMLTEGWVPARGERTETGQPATTFTTPSRTSAGFARRGDPATAQRAGAVAAAAQSITVNSHQGQLLSAFSAQHTRRPGIGYTAAEAVAAANLLTDGATGSPWRRVTDLRDAGLLTFLLDGTGHRMARKNESNSDGQVLVITPLGLRATVALSALSEHGYPDYPLLFDGHDPAALFEDLPATLARIDTLPAIDASDTAVVTADPDA